MKKLFLILPLILLTTACATPKTVLKSDKGQVVMCGGDRSSSASLGMIGYYLQKQVDKDCVNVFKKNGFKVIEKED